jgi:hypothetical protein
MAGFLFRDSNLDSLADNLFEVATAFPATSPPVVAESLSAFARANGTVKFLKPDGTVIDSLAAVEGTSGAAVHVSRWKNPNSFVITADGGNVWLTSRAPQGGVTAPDRKITIGRRALSVAATGLFARGALTAFIADGDLYLVGETLELQSGFPRSGIDAVSSPALGDIDGDGVRDIVVFSRRSIWAFHDNGAVVDNFPAGLSLAETDSIASAPVIADVNGDAVPEIIAASNRGLVYAIDRSGVVVKGFPLQAGTGRQSVSVFDVKVPLLQCKTQCRNARVGH